MADHFPTTRWSVLTSGASPEAPEFQEAFDYLARAYWRPLYAYVRWRGRSRDEALDLTQSFFLHLVDTGFLSKADRDRGRFRTFLLSSLRNFLVNEHARATSKKRFPGAPLVSLEAGEDGFLAIDPVDDQTPDEIFQQRWAETVVRLALKKLEDEQERLGQRQRFELLSPWLLADKGRPYHEIAAVLDSTVSAVKVSVHRLRKRFGELLRAEIAATVASEDLVDQEVRFLLEKVKG